jgi:hypothetical protein
MRMRGLLTVGFRTPVLTEKRHATHTKIEKEEI